MIYNILNEFTSTFPEIVNKMKNTDHHGPKYFSPNHMEGDVWTHTMLCLNHFLNFNDKEYIDKDVEKSIIFAILCHDIGKCFTRATKEDGKVTFYSHANYSIRDTIQILYTFKDIFDDFEKVCNLVLPAVANHIDLYNQSKNKHMYFNNDLDLYHVCNQLAICDANGSICMNKKYDVVDFDYVLPELHERNVYVFCGAPGSGKDYLAEKKGLPIVSLDNERIKIFKENNDVSGMTDKEIYQDAFVYCNENKIDLMKCMKKTVKSIKGDYCICNTNLNKKARRSLINQLGKANYHCIYVIADIKTLHDRDLQRDSKTVGWNVINRMTWQQQIPSMKEGFSSVKIECN
jgi:predicted kinase